LGVIARMEVSCSNGTNAGYAWVNGVCLCEFFKIQASHATVDVEEVNLEVFLNLFIFAYMKGS
jgi:hypothetical protein